MISTFRGKYYFLSNFSPSLIPFYGIWYPTVEHAYQASKSLDYDIKFEISQINSKNAAEAKRTGRRIDCRSDWNKIKVSLMFELIRIKFAIPELRVRLLGTGTEDIMEINTWGDNFWGVSGKLSDGKNMLGKIYMQVRRELQKYYGVINKSSSIFF